MPSFDIVCKTDLQEIDNVVNSVLRELSNRYDFKGAQFSIIIDNKENQIALNAPDNYKLTQIGESLKAFCAKRKIDVRTLEFGKLEKAAGNNLKQIVKIKQGIDQESAKEIVKNIKAGKLKVQVSIKGDEVRVDGKKRDDLQEVIFAVKSMNMNLPLQFINFRE